MNTDQLKKAIELQNQIECLGIHINSIESTMECSKKDPKDLAYGEDVIATEYPLTLNSHDRNSNSDRKSLYKDFIGIEEFLFVYIMRAKQRLAQLKKEFEAL